MDNEQRQETVSALVDAKRCLADAWQIPMEPTVGLRRRTSAPCRAREHRRHLRNRVCEHLYNADIASPVEVQQFWEKYGELPGFAARNS